MTNVISVIHTTRKTSKIPAPANAIIKKEEKKKKRKSFAMFQFNYKNQKMLLKL